jgi:hypothetical protein
MDRIIALTVIVLSPTHSVGVKVQKPTWAFFPVGQTAQVLGSVPTASSSALLRMAN